MRKKTAPTEKKTFEKQQLARSSKMASWNMDALQTVLKQDVPYTIAEAEQAIRQFMKKEAN
ncbi:hypothetical protein PA598K_04202 [Paenibacillus sp. 598K]|uniref:hypothetical protein n=1 Tax=Paenibacillus sp. 598K TaxID=1117987 RepID=UPI000FF93C85|nr:hypothetical protein [Paenibacillus sp. 598K]GBF75771.1 hypothetical protein PA598K_04202 [Paenibacillus sp. 598K]